MTYTGKNVKGRGHRTRSSVVRDQSGNSVMKGVIPPTLVQSLSAFQLGFPILTIAMPCGSVIKRYWKRLRIVMYLRTLFLVLAWGNTRLKVSSLNKEICWWGICSRLACLLNFMGMIPNSSASWVTINWVTFSDITYELLTEQCKIHKKNNLHVTFLFPLSKCYALCGLYLLPLERRPTPEVMVKSK